MAENSQRHDHEPSRAWRGILVATTVLALVVRRACRRAARPDPVTPGSEHPAESVKRYGHEAPGVAWRRVLVIAALLALMVVIVVLGNYAALHVWLAPHHAQVMARRGQVPPEPRLQPHPRNDLAEFRAHKHALLSTYAWTDTSHAYARIPIERAMAIYAKQHVARPAAAATQGAPR